MTGLAWLPYALASLMLGTSAYCLSRLVISVRQHRRTGRDVDAAHVLAGVAMAGMLLPRLRLPWTAGWDVVFGAGVLWFGWQAIRRRSAQPAVTGRSHQAQHALGCLAMLYMLLTLGSAAAAGHGPAGIAGMAGMAGGASRLPVLALVLAVALLGYVVWTADRLSSLTPAASPAGHHTAGRLSSLTPAASPADHHTAALLSSPAPASFLAGVREPPGLPAPPPSRRAPSWRTSPSRRAPLSPRLAACCDIVMGVTMGYMLIVML